MTTTYGMASYNALEQDKALLINAKREMTKARLEKRDTNSSSSIVPYEAQVADQDVVQSRKLDISILNGKVRVFQDFANDLDDHIEFYEPGKFYSIFRFDSLSYQKQVTIETRLGLTNSFNSMTAYTFGRGLSTFLGFVNQLDKLSDNQYKLTFFNSSDNKWKVSEFELDSTKGYCWTLGCFYSQDGSVEAKCTATDFREFNNTWFPYHVEIVSYTKGEFSFKHDLTIEEISSLSDSVIDLNVFDDIPSDSVILKDDGPDLVEEE